MIVLSSTGLSALRKALQRLEPMTLEFTRDGERVRASVVPVGGPWTVAMAVRVERRTPNGMYSSQYFESVEEAEQWTRDSPKGSRG